MTRVTGCGRPYHTFAMSAASGVSVVCDATTVIGAKREASAWISYGGGDITVTNNQTNETWMRKFWTIGPSFGWGRWRLITARRIGCGRDTASSRGQDKRIGGADR